MASQKNKMVVVSRKVACSSSPAVSPKATRRQPRRAGGDKSSSSSVGGGGVGVGNGGNMRALIRRQQGLDARLGENIAAIERHLAHLHDERMYLEAATVQEELKKLKAQRHDQSTSYWVKRHERTISGLREQREGLFASAGRLLTDKLAVAQTVYEEDMRDLKDRHRREIQLLRGALALGAAGAGSSYSGGSGRRSPGPDMLPLASPTSDTHANGASNTKTNSPTRAAGAAGAGAAADLNAAASPKYSSKVLSLLTSEKRLARGRMYARAAKARADAETLMAEERKEQAKADFKVRQGKMSRLRLQHKHEEKTLRERFENQRRRLVSECRNDQKLISVRVRKTRSELSRARNLRVAMTTSSDPVLSEAAQKASIRGERAAAELPLAASPERLSLEASGRNGSSSRSRRGSRGGGGGGRTRPQSAHNMTRRRRSGGKSKRPGSAPPRRLDHQRGGGGGGGGSESGGGGSSLLHVVADGGDVVSRPGSAVSSRRPWSSTTNESSRPESAVGGRTGAGGFGRRRRRRKGKRRKKKKRPLKTCTWCGEHDGHVERMGGLAIPNPSRPGQGTGCFCSWECASSHVFKYFPIQDRWIAELLIQDAAGYFVKRSKRANNRLQGPGIPNI